LPCPQETGADRAETRLVTGLDKKTRRPDRPAGALELGSSLPRPAWALDWTSGCACHGVRRDHACPLRCSGLLLVLLPARLRVFVFATVRTNMSRQAGFTTTAISLTSSAMTGWEARSVARKLGCSEARNHANLMRVSGYCSSSLRPARGDREIVLSAGCN
jgi:hypothetical protein